MSDFNTGRGRRSKASRTAVLSGPVAEGMARLELIHCSMAASSYMLIAQPGFCFSQPWNWSGSLDTFLILVLMVDGISVRDQPSSGNRLTAERAEVMTFWAADGICDDVGEENASFTAFSSSAV